MAQASARRGPWLLWRLIDSSILVGNSNWQVARLSAVQDLVHEISGTAPAPLQIHTIAGEAPGDGVGAVSVDGRQLPAFVNADAAI